MNLKELKSELRHVENEVALSPLITRVRGQQLRPFYDLQEIADILGCSKWKARNRLERFGVQPLPHRSTQPICYSLRELQRAFGDLWLLHF